MSFSYESMLLQRRVSEIRVENCNAQRFVPEDQLRQIMSRSMVTKVLVDIGPAYFSDEAVDFILNRAVKIFGILALISQTHKIGRFIQNDQFGNHNIDHQLPFTESRLEEIFKDNFIAGLFFEKQWEFAVPTFSGQVVPRVLERWTVLPYLSETYLLTGGFGSVFKMKIHSSYRTSSEHITEFVRKEFGLDDCTFENEAHILSTLQRLKHPNILPLIGCYTYRSKHNLVSPFIEGGNLREFLGGERPQNWSHEELLYSLSGLASAIWALHEFFFDGLEPSMKGHHQDLKPDNILVDGSRFILADFGLSSIKSLSSNSKTPFKGRKGYCQAPECVELSHPYQEYEVTRAADIFAFACIIVDLLVFFAKGGSGVQEFRGAREFDVPPMCYSLYHKGDSSNETVGTWLKQIAGEIGSPSVHDVVQLVNQMLEISPIQRPKAALVTAKLYISTIKGFSEVIMTQFSRLRSSLEVFIENSRFSSWVAGQDIDLFLAMSGAVTTSRFFESIIKLLRQMNDALKIIDGNAAAIDGRLLLDVRSLNTQLLSKLSPEQRSNTRSRLESILLSHVDSAGLDFTPAKLESAFGKSRISQMAETKRLIAHAGEASPSSTFRTVERRDFFQNSVGPLKTARLHYQQPSRCSHLLLETIEFQDPITYQRSLPRIRALCNLLASRNIPRQLRIPPFYALCTDAKAFRYHLLYKYPPGDGEDDRQVVPFSLRNLLEERDSSSYPSLETRLMLALSLAEALSVIHDVRWFHKDLTSSNILFFPATDTPSSVRARDPYFFGFQHSHDATEDFTEGPLQDRTHQRYHHPDYISVENQQFKRFIRQYDWYSLGMVLLEVGLWSVVGDIMKDHADKSNADFAAIIIQEKVPLLSFFVGQQYSEIVRYCLTRAESVHEEGQSGTEHISSSSIPNLLFKQRVVFPLQTLVTIHSTQEVTRKRRHSPGQDGKTNASFKRRAM